MYMQTCKNCLHLVAALEEAVDFCLEPPGAHAVDNEHGCAARGGPDRLINHPGDLIDAHAAHIHRVVIKLDRQLLCRGRALRRLRGLGPPSNCLRGRSERIIMQPQMSCRLKVRHMAQGSSCDEHHHMMNPMLDD